MEIREGCRSYTWAIFSRTRQEQQQQLLITQPARTPQRGEINKNIQMLLVPPSFSLRQPNPPAERNIHDRRPLLTIITHWRLRFVSMAFYFVTSCREPSASKKEERKKNEKREATRAVVVKATYSIWQGRSDKEKKEKGGRNRSARQGTETAARVDKPIHIFKSPEKIFYMT